MTKEERQEALYHHVMKLREENSELRGKLIHSFMDAIIQSLNEEDPEA